MTPVILACNPQQFSELGQADRSGQPLPRSRQTHVVMQVPIECTSEDKEIDVAFYVRGQVSVAQANAVGGEFAREFSVAATIARSAFALLPKWKTWLWHTLLEVPVSGELHLVSSTTLPVSAEIEIAPELARSLRTETRLRREAKRAFEKAKDYLWKMMGRHLSHEASQIRNAARFIEACRNREAWNYGHAFDDNRHRRLMADIEHLLQLKDPTRSNVRAAEDVRTLIFDSHFPEFWKAAPPRPADYDLEWLM